MLRIHWTRLQRSLRYTCSRKMCYTCTVKNRVSEGGGVVGGWWGCVRFFSGFIWNIIRYNTAYIRWDSDYTGVRRCMASVLPNYLWNINNGGVEMLVLLSIWLKSDPRCFRLDPRSDISYTPEHRWSGLTLEFTECLKMFKQ